tara:strand:+ start:526 stop:1278 length:753 start_codon:yes stop_codon:yes gene_type:complete
MLFFKASIFVLFLSSCAYLEVIGQKQTDPSSLKDKASFSYNDVSGQYKLNKQFGQNKSGEFILKKELRASASPKYLERFLSITTKKKFGKRTEYLFPKVSESIFWFDQKKHKSLIKINGSHVEVVSSVDRTVYKKEKILMENGRLHCFFSQLIECAATTNFLGISAQKKLGSMSLNIIWDGYPFFNEQYLNQTNSIIQRARISYMSELNGLIKYQLEVDDQVLFYFIDSNFKTKKFYWVSKGISQVHESL